MEQKDIIPREKMMGIIDDIIDMKVKAVTFTGGGEPLLYPPFIDCVEKLAGAGVRVAAITNGSKLNGKIAEALAQYGTWVRISIDAWDGPSYAKSRNIKENEFDKVVDNMRNFARLDSDCVLGISFIIDENNAGHIFEFNQLMKDAGVDNVKLSACVVSNEGKENNAYHDKIRDLVRSEIDKSLSLCDDSFAVVDHYHEAEERFDKSYTTCSFLQYLTVIGADSKVYTCQDKAYTKEGCLGSFENTSFNEFWFSEENRRNIFSLDPSVSCRHHCVAHRKNLAILEHLSLDPEHSFFV